MFPPPGVPIGKNLFWPAIYDTRPVETIANILVCLIHQTNYLLDQQIRQLEQAFLKEGGLRERMTRARIEARNHHDKVL